MTHFSWKIVFEHTFPYMTQVSLYFTENDVIELMTSPFDKVYPFQ